VAFRSPRQGEFEPADLATISRLAGHFGRALGLRLEQERTERDLFLVNQMLDDLSDAVFLVDRSLRVRHVNAAGRTLLEAGKGLRAQGGRLGLHDRSGDERLARMAADGRGGEMRLSAGIDAEFIVVAHPGAAGFGDGGSGYMTIRITDLSRDRRPPTPERLMDRLGLSPRQAAVVELAAGQTEAEAAQKLKLAASTLHTHLQRAYDRLELHSRADLLVLLARHGFETTRTCEKFLTCVIYIDDTCASDFPRDCAERYVTI
jgi:DNA-binding CsgD family transcriptional regulator